MAQYISDTSTPASKIIQIDSQDASLLPTKDADGNVLTTDFVYQMKEAILCPDHLSMVCTLHTCSIPYSFFNIRHDVNNTIVLDYTSTNPAYTGLYKVVIPSGSYNAVTLLSTFLEIMKGSSDFLRSTWNSTATLYRIYKEDAGVYKSFEELNIDFNPFTSNQFQLPTNIKASLMRARLRYHFWESTLNLNELAFKWAASTAGNVFGFRKDVGGPTDRLVIPADADETDGIQYLQSDKSIDMSDQIHGLYVRTNLTTDGTLDSLAGTFSNVLSRIPINVNYGGIIFHTPNNSSHHMQITSAIIKTIGVKLTDDRNRIIDLQGLNWQISFQIDYVPRFLSLKGLTRTERRIPGKIPQTPVADKHIVATNKNDLDEQTRTLSERKSSKTRRRS